MRETKMANKQTMRARINVLINALKLEGIELVIESYSPGDGWTRYSVAYVTGNGGHPVLASSMNGTECVYYLQGMYDCIRFKDEIVRRKESSSIEYDNDCQ